jgi:hypothetical protein
MELQSTFERRYIYNGERRTRISVVDAMIYAKAKGITLKQARLIFDKHYTPTMNGWYKKE